MCFGLYDPLGKLRLWCLRCNTAPQQCYLLTCSASRGTCALIPDVLCPAMCNDRLTLSIDPYPNPNSNPSPNTTLTLTLTLPLP